MADTSASPARPYQNGPDADLLTEIRERYQYGTEQWQHNRDEGAIDIRYIGGDPWDPKDRVARETANRPCVVFDELSQYVNQLINDVRENKRAIKVTPQGNGANDKTAEFRQNLIRQIENRSNAQIAYTGMFEDAAQRGYGFLRVKARYENANSFNQELLIEAIPNPDNVTIDPDHLSPDAADAQWCFIAESMPIEKFRREFPDAEIKDFTPDDVNVAPQWLSNPMRVQVAEYWKIEHKGDVLYQIEGLPTGVIGPDGLPQFGPPTLVYKSDLKGDVPPATTIEQEREVSRPYVCHYMTNGVEVLKKKGQKSAKTEWPGKSLPIVSCYGKILYRNLGKGVVRETRSLVRNARDPQMLVCYYRTTEAEVISMTPKTPFVGYEGQFRNHEDKWASVNQTPIAYLEAAPTTEKTGQAILPLPQRQPYDPPIQSLEVGSESARRGIQAAIGINPLPTSAQGRNEKSGVALRQIQDSTQKGSYHFVDHYDLAITRTGTILDDLIPTYYDTSGRAVTIRQEDDTPKTVAINDPQDPKAYNATEGDHDVTISVGPAYASQREASDAFADQLAGMPEMMPIIGDLVVKLKNLGPVGDQISSRLKALLAPPVKAVVDAEDGGASPEVAAVQGQAQMQIQQLQQQLQEAAKIIETEQAKQQAQVEIAKIDAQKDIEIQRLRGETEMAKAQLDASVKAQDTNTKAAVDLTKIRVDHDANAQALEAGQQSEREGRFADHLEAQAGREHASAEGEANRQVKASASDR